MDYLFFKVFRYVDTRNLIFKNIKKSENYNDLKFITTILSNFSNGIEIIKDKLKSGGELILSNEGKELSIIYNIDYKDNQENLEFFNKFFKKFSSILNVEYSYESFEFQLMEIIKHSNIVALKSYLNLFSTYTYVYRIKKVILEEIKKNCEINLTNELIYKFNNYKQFKMFKYLIENFNKEVSEIIKKIKSFKIVSPDNFISLKLKQLIKLNEFIINFNSELCPYCKNQIFKIEYSTHIGVCFNSFENKKRKQLKELGNNSSDDQKEKEEEEDQEKPLIQEFTNYQLNQPIIPIQEFTNYQLNHYQHYHHHLYQIHFFI